MTTIYDVIEVYKTNIDKVRKMYTYHFNQACNAIGRGDVRSYRKHTEAALDMQNRMMAMNKLMANVKQAYTM